LLHNDKQLPSIVSIIRLNHVNSSSSGDKYMENNKLFLQVQLILLAIRSINRIYWD